MGNNTKWIGILIIVAGILQISCSIKSPYVGKTYNTSNWCKYPILFSSCKYDMEHVIIIVNKLNMDVDGEYYMEGLMELKGLSNIFNKVTVEGTTFTLVLAKDSIIVETKSFFPAHAETKGKFPFNLKFKSPPFDSYAFDYEFRVTDQAF